MKACISEIGVELVEVRTHAELIASGLRSAEAAFGQEGERGGKGLRVGLEGRHALGRAAALAAIAAAAREHGAGDLFTYASGLEAAGAAGG